MSKYKQFIHLAKCDIKMKIKKLKYKFVQSRREGKRAQKKSNRSGCFGPTRHDRKSFSCPGVLARGQLTSARTHHPDRPASRVHPHRERERNACLPHVQRPRKLELAPVSLISSAARSEEFVEMSLNEREEKRVDLHLRNEEEHASSKCTQERSLFAEGDKWGAHSTMIIATRKQRGLVAATWPTTACVTVAGEQHMHFFRARSWSPFNF